MWTVKGIQSESGRGKTLLPGHCAICNDPKPTKRTIIKADFCQACWDLMLAGNEDELIKRTVRDK